MFYYIQAIWGFVLSTVLLGVWFVKVKRGTMPEEQAFIIPALAELFSVIAIAQTLYGAKLIGRVGAATIMGLALLAYVALNIWQLKTLRKQRR